MTHAENENLTDLSPRELAVLVPFLAMIVLMGVYPQPFLQRIEPAIKSFVVDVQTGAMHSDLAATDLPAKSESVVLAPRVIH